jgi:6-phosphogluconolactonase
MARDGKLMFTSVMTKRAALPMSFPASLVVLAIQACSSDAESTTDRPTGGSARDGGSDPAVTDGGAVVPGADAGNDAATPKPAGPLFAFVGSTDGKIRVFDVDATSGAWTPKRESNAGSNPSFLAFEPARRRVFATDEAAGGLVRAFAFDPATGALAEVNNKPAGGAGTTHVSLDPTGNWALAANYTGGTMSVLPVGANGALGNAVDTKASGAMSHWAGTNPSGTHVFVPALGANVVTQYKLDLGTGKLSDNGTATLPSGAGPRHLAFHASEKWAYVVNELAVSVTAFDFDRATGKLTPKATVSALPAGQSANGVSGAEIFVHPSGKFVYASTRGFNTIARFTVDTATGSLTRVDNTPTGANRPRSFGTDPEGTLLYAGNQDANQVVGFRIDAATGALTSLGAPVTVPSPTFVGLVRVP